MPEGNVPLFNADEYAAWFDAQVGKPYILGQPVPFDDPTPAAADCSGLIIAGNNTAGAYRMGDDTAAGLYNRSRAVVGEPKPGDMVFLRNNPARSNGIGHMAVLTKKLSNGDWRIIEARGRAYGVVRTTLSYWKTRSYYAGLRRLPAFKLATISIPVPSKPKVTGVNVTVYNCQDPRFGGEGNDDTAVLKKAASSVFLLTEAPEKVRTNARIGLGGMSKMLVWERVSQAIMFDRTKWQHGSEEDVIRVTFGPTSYHGGVIAVLTSKKTGEKIQYAVLHLPPTGGNPKKPIATEADRKRYLTKFLAKLDPDLPTIIGGDFNSKNADDWLRAAGFDVIGTPATTDNGKTLDYLGIRNGQKIGLHWVDGAVVLNPGGSSDHRAVKGKVRTNALIDTN